MNIDPVHYYYKDPETGVEMSFSRTEEWGWAVGFHGVDFMSSINYTGKIPWPTLTKEQKQIVDRNYENLMKAMAEEDENE